ncbi:hypothetical protein TNCV_5064791 [Trichonephila clavipes]|nr:hypothetical protein TNCV_5064791 [Trichonephila clavipes]
MEGLFIKKTKKEQSIPAVAPPTLRLSKVSDVHLPRSLTCSCPQPLSSVFEEKKPNKELVLKIEEDRKDLLNSLGGPLSSLIGERSSSEHGSPHFSPTSLALGDNRPERRKQTPTQYLVHHLESYKLPSQIDTQGMSLS